MSVIQQHIGASVRGNFHAHVGWRFVYFGTKISCKKVDLTNVTHYVFIRNNKPVLLPAVFSSFPVSLTFLPT